MTLKEMTCCSWHSPRNSIVYTRTGAPVPKDRLDGIPDSPDKQQMMHSGNMCDPCARAFLGRLAEPLSEGPRAAMPGD